MVFMRALRVLRLALHWSGVREWYDIGQWTTCFFHELATGKGGGELGDFKESLARSRNSRQ